MNTLTVCFLSDPETAIKKIHESDMTAVYILSLNYIFTLIFD